MSEKIHICNNLKLFRKKNENMLCQFKFFLKFASGLVVKGRLD